MSTESNFSFTTKVAGDLLTVRGDTVAEFESNLSGILSRAEAIAPALTHLQGFGAAAPLTGPQQPVATPTVTMPPTTPTPPPTPRRLRLAGPRPSPRLLLLRSICASTASP